MFASSGEPFYAVEADGRLCFQSIQVFALVDEHLKISEAHALRN